MKRSTQHGWLLLEAMLAMVCVAFVLSATQYQLNQLTQQMLELQTEHQLGVQTALQEQMSKVFAETPSVSVTQVSPPNCQQCRGAQLQQVLRYELSQW